MLFVKPHDVMRSLEGMSIAILEQSNIIRPTKNVPRIGIKNTMPKIFYRIK